MSWTELQHQDSELSRLDFPLTVVLAQISLSTQLNENRVPTDYQK